MATRKENGGMSVPQFGGWNEKTGAAHDYSMIFSRARANRKQQHKTSDVVKKASIADDDDEFAVRNHHQLEECSSKRKKLLGYLCLLPKTPMSSH